MMHRLFNPRWYALFIILLVVSACGGESPKENTEEPKEQKQKSADQGSMLKVGDKLFNVPSPIETAFLISEVGGNFEESILNPNTDATKYSTKQDRALNLGIYGADLGYSLIYNQSQKAFSYLTAAKKLGTELGISSALYVDLMKRFEGNMENKDSLLLFITEMNQLSDEYLKDNESEDVSALILFGGWIESLYFTTQLSTKSTSEKLESRIGEQKNTLNNLVSLMTQQNLNGDFDDLIANLKDLEASFQKVDYQYEFVEPTTLPDQKITKINSKSSVKISPEVLKEIVTKVEKIRNSIIA